MFKLLLPTEREQNLQQNPYNISQHTLKYVTTLLSGNKKFKFVTNLGKVRRKIYRALM